MYKIDKKLAKPNKTIREHTDDLLTNLNILKSLNYIDDDIFYLLRLACEYHDYGKINDEFQKRVKSNIKLRFNNEKEVAHNVLSLCFLNKNDFLSIDDFYIVYYAILNHHHNVNNFEEINNKEELINNFIYKYNLNRIKGRIISKINNLKENKKAQLVKGFLHKCDYAASGGYQIEYINDFLEESLNGMGYKWNNLQIFCKKNNEKNIISIANTGMGKTEAGLLWIGNNKGFFILPLKTAINAIYDRVTKQIVIDDIDERVSLLHSDTLSYYIENNILDDESILEYNDRGKNLSLPLTISTLDQIFDFVFKYPGFELKLATLSYAKVVIDEIQAYSPDLLAYLIIGLENIVKVGGKFAILTATLPPFVKDYIYENIPDIVYDKFTKGKNRHNVKVLEEQLNEKFIVNHYNLKKSKVLVVCNTVKKAQEIYRKLKTEMPNEEINLLHAKFTKRDRRNKENNIFNFGRTDNNSDGIWVSTSLVEASLDIDFDYLITELNDLNGFFQRLGRVNRKGLKENYIDEPNVFVFTEIDKNLLLNENRTRGFIDSTIYNLSREALLQEVDGILEENKKTKIINKYLTSENIKDSSFDKEYKKIKNYVSNLFINEESLNDVKKKFRNILSYDVIPESVYNENIEIIKLNEKILSDKFEVKESENKNNKINRLHLFKIKRRKAKEAIKQFTVSVGIYDLKKTGVTVDIINEKIEVVKCEYSFENGFVRMKSNKKETEIDTFI